METGGISPLHMPSDPARTQNFPRRSSMSGSSPANGSGFQDHQSLSTALSPTFDFWIRPAVQSADGANQAGHTDQTDHGILRGSHPSLRPSGSGSGSGLLSRKVSQGSAIQRHPSRLLSPNKDRISKYSLTSAQFHHPRPQQRRDGRLLNVPHAQMPLHGSSQRSHSAGDAPIDPRIRIDRTSDETNHTETHRPSHMQVRPPRESMGSSGALVPPISNSTISPPASLISTKDDKQAVENPSTLSRTRRGSRSKIATHDHRTEAQRIQQSKLSEHYYPGQNIAHARLEATGSMEDVLSAAAGWYKANGASNLRYANEALQTNLWKRWADDEDNWDNSNIWVAARVTNGSASSDVYGMPKPK